MTTADVQRKRCVRGWTALCFFRQLARGNRFFQLAWKAIIETGIVGTNVAIGLIVSRAPKYVFNSYVRSVSRRSYARNNAAALRVPSVAAAPAFAMQSILPKPEFPELASFGLPTRSNGQVVIQHVTVKPMRHTMTATRG